MEMMVEFLQTDGSGNLSFSVVQGVPAGSVFALAGTQAGVPTGYLECDGSSVSRSTYAALFAVIGTTYGSASSTTFNLPNLRGQFIRGVNTTGSGTDANRNIGSSQSEDNKSHNHSISVSGTTSQSNSHFNWRCQKNIRRLSSTRYCQWYIYKRTRWK